MIWSVFLYLGGALLTAFAGLFGLFSFVIPTEITDSIIYFLSQMGYVGYLFPIGTLFQAAGVYLSAIMLLYTVKLFLFLWSMVPYFGKPIELPTLSKNVTDLRNLPRGTVDLKYGKSRGKIDRRMRF